MSDAADSPPPANRRGALLHLTGPLQSWGERSRFTQRDTARFPTRSGLIGLIAASLGRHRDEPIEDLRQLRFAIRADRPGSLLRDFHTVGGGLANKQTVITAEGKRRPGDTGTLVSHRFYLQDAAFTVAVTTDDPALLERCTRALAEPCWPPYLGRRSCPPDGHVLLGVFDDAWHALSHLPLHRRLDAGRDKADVPINYYADQPLETLPLPTGCSFTGIATTSTVTDEPISFTSLDRQYRARVLHGRVVLTPRSHERIGGLGGDYLRALSRHAQAGQERTGTP